MGFPEQLSYLKDEGYVFQVWGLDFFLHELQ